MPSSAQRQRGQGHAADMRTPSVTGAPGVPRALAQDKEPRQALGPGHAVPQGVSAHHCTLSVDTGPGTSADRQGQRSRLRAPQGGGRGSAAPRTSARSSASHHVELTRCGPGVSPRRCGFYEAQVASLENPRETIWKRLSIGAGLVKAVECAGFGCFESRSLVGDDAEGAANGPAGTPLPPEERAEAWTSQGGPPRMRME